MTMHVVIPARYGSSRLPGKPLIDLCGKPMIVRSWECVRRDVPAEQITVATDDTRIVDVCRDYGIAAIMTSPDCRTGTDRAAELIETMLDVDVCVVAMGDNPLLPAGVIPVVVGGLGKRFSAAIGRASVSRETAHNDPTVQKLALAADGRLVYISRHPIPWTRDGCGPYYKAVNVFAIWASALQTYTALETGQCEAREGLEILRFVEHDYAVNTVDVSGDGWSVDVQADVDKTREYLWGRY